MECSFFFWHLSLSHFHSFSYYLVVGVFLLLSHRGLHFCFLPRSLTWSVKIFGSSLSMVLSTQAAFPPLPLSNYVRYTRDQPFSTFSPWRNSWNHLLFLGNHGIKIVTFTGSTAQCTKFKKWFYFSFLLYALSRNPWWSSGLQLSSKAQELQYNECYHAANFKNNDASSPLNPHKNPRAFHRTLWLPRGPAEKGCCRHE